MSDRSPASSTETTVTLPAADTADGPPLVVRIPGRPMSWKRTAGNGRGRYTPPEQRARQDEIRLETDLALRALGRFDRPVWLPDERLALEVWSCYPRPKRGGTPLPGHADVDNLAKIVLDALEGLLYANDRQVASLLTLKGWDDAGDGFVEIVARNVYPTVIEPRGDTR